MGNEKNQDIETENLKLAIEQIADDETAALPHIEQLSSAVAENSGDASTQAASAPVDIEPAEAASEKPDRVSSWFLTFMCMNIPIVGWIYLFYLAFSKKKRDRRNFARAYLFYKLVFLVAGLILLAVITVTAMNLLEELLDYMQML